MSTVVLSIKGGSIRTKLEYVKDTFGSAGEEKLTDLLKSADAYPILEANWYPYELFNQVLCFIAAEFLDGDLSRLEEVGRYSAKRSLTGVYQSFKQREFLNFVRHRLPKLHTRYYSAGQLDVIQLSDRGCRLCLTSPTYYESDLRVAAGFYQGAAEIMGQENPTCRFEIKDGRAHFLLLWSSDEG